MNERTRPREANIELMRIILFVMVVCLHTVAPYRVTRFDKFLFSWQFTSALASISRLCTNCFVLIAGYFYASSRKRRPAYTLIKLLVPVAAYLPFYFLLDLNMGFTESLRRVMLGLFTSEFNLYHLWFVQVFLVLSLIAPLLSYALEHADHRTHRNAMLALLAASCVLPSFTHMTGLNWFDLPLFESKLSLFITLYVIGAYIRNYPPNLSALRSGMVFLAAELILCVGSVLYNTRYSPINLIALMTGKMQSLSEGAWIEVSGLSGALSDTNNLLVVAASVAMLIFFTKINVESAVIPRISRHVFGAYIIHVFWIQILSRVRGTYYDLYSNFWLEHENYPLLVLGYILFVVICSLATNALLSWLYRLAVRYARGYAK